MEDKEPGSDEVTVSRRNLNRQQHWATFATILCTAAIVAAMICNAWYTRRVQHQSDQRWCNLLVSLDQPVPEGAQLTPRQRKIQLQLHDLRSDFSC